MSEGTHCISLVMNEIALDSFKFIVCWSPDNKNESTITIIPISWKAVITLESSLMAELTNSEALNAKEN